MAGQTTNSGRLAAHLESDTAGSGCCESCRLISTLCNCEDKNKGTSLQRVICDANGAAVYGKGCFNEAAQKCCNAASGCSCAHVHEQQQAIAELFGYCEISSIDAMLLSLIARIGADHPGLLQRKITRSTNAADEVRKCHSTTQLSDEGSSVFHAEQCPTELAPPKQCSFATSPTQNMVRPQRRGFWRADGAQVSGGKSIAYYQGGPARIVVIGLEGCSTTRDSRLLHWTRRHMLQQQDIVVLVCCWEKATEPKYLRVPGMILSSTCPAGAYNREHQQAVIQRMHKIASSSLPGRHTYCLAAPVGRVRKNFIGELLVRVVTELHGDAIIVGVRSHWQLRRMLFGSVAAYARSRSPCPVIQVST